MMDDKLRKLAEGLVDSYEKAYRIHKIDVDDITSNKITDINYIERTLDYCLDIYTDKGFYLFIKLLLYYKTVNLENAYAYLEILKKCREEEYEEFVKKYKK